MTDVVMSDGEDRYWNVGLGSSRVDVRLPEYNNDFPMVVVIQSEHDADG